MFNPIMAGDLLGRCFLGLGYLKENYCLSSDQNFSFKYMQNVFKKLIRKLSRMPWVRQAWVG